MTEQTQTVSRIPVSLIKENPIALRSVNKQSEQYLELVDSIRSMGVQTPINVTPRKDADTGEEYYLLVDGLQRLNATRDAGIDTIPVFITSLDEDQVLEVQIITNVQRIETKPVEYSRQLVRILLRHPTMTENELASKLGKSSAWIRQRLSLNKIENPQIMELINNGDICLANAYALAALPADEMPNYVEAAITEPTEEFTPKVKARVKEVNEANNKGSAPKEAGFVPVEHLQKMKDIKEARSSESAVIKSLIIEPGVKDPVKAALTMLDWILHVDPISLEVQKMKYDEKIKAKQEREAKRAAEREAKKKEKEAKAIDAEAAAKKS